MKNVQLNENTYNNIERIRLNSSGGGTVDFVDAETFDNMIAGIPFALHDTVVTNLKWCQFQSANFTVNLPNVLEIGEKCFMASYVTEIRLPKVRAITITMCGNASKLVKCILSEYVSAIPAQAFYGTAKMTTLVLPYNGVVALSGSQIFTNSSIESGTGYVYVPSSQVENYKADSAWSAYANQIRAIEDYPDEVA